jgi:sirohydrochlorin ferrochelatase
MQALVLIAHGSRRAASNQEVKNLASRLQNSATDRFQLVETGFLEIASPSIPQAIESCIEAGATSLVIVPYFLAAGRHVAEDIPQIVEPVAQQHRHVAIHIAEHIGASESMSKLVLESANSISTQGADSALEQAG